MDGTQYSNKEYVSIGEVVVQIVREFTSLTPLELQDSYFQKENQQGFYDLPYLSSKLPLKKSARPCVVEEGGKVARVGSRGPA